MDTTGDKITEDPPPSEGEWSRLTSPVTTTDRFESAERGTPVPGRSTIIYPERQAEDPATSAERIRRDHVMSDRLARYTSGTRHYINLAEWFDLQQRESAKYQAEIPQKIADLEAQIKQMKEDLVQIEDGKKSFEEKYGKDAELGRTIKKNIDGVSAWLNMETDELPAGWRE